MTLATVYLLTTRFNALLVGCIAAFLLAVVPEVAQAQDISSQTPSRVGEAAPYAVKAGKSANADQVLQLDDGSAENAIGFNDDTNSDGTDDQSLGALYFNRFTPPVGDFPLELHDVQVQFGTLDDDGNVADGGLSAGDVIDIYVWSDADGDPTTGATIEAVLTDQALGTIDASFQTFAFPSAVRINRPGDVLIGFVNRTLPSAATYPATIDETASQGRSWVAAYANRFGDTVPPGNPPVLPADGDDDLFEVIDDVNAELAGNWMIRGGYDVLTGSESQPLSFAPQIGPTNPFDGITNVDSVPGFGDLDGDGDLDMALIDNSLSETFAYYENTGSATSPNYVKRTGSDSPLFGFQVSNPGVPSFADLDGDGDLDMLGGAFSNDKFAYFENLGTSTNPIFVDRRGDLNPFSDVASPLRLYTNPHFNDIDNDGDFDVVATRVRAGVVLLENTGTPTAPVFELRTGSDNPFSSTVRRNASAAFTADLDEDGDLDLLAVVRASNSFRYYENVGSPSIPLFERRAGTANPLDGFSLSIQSSGFSAVDIDGDGDTDIVRNIRRGTPEEGLMIFENGGTSLSTVRPASANPLDGVELVYTRFNDTEDNPVFADVDGDGDLDLVVGRREGTEFSYFENVGSSTQPDWMRREGAGNPFDGLSTGDSFINGLSSPELVDLDGDGDLDLVSGSRFARLFYYENLGTETNPIYVSREGSANPFNELIEGVGRKFPQFLDFDKDGDLDLVVGSPVVGSPFDRLEYYENTGNAVSPMFVRQTDSHNVESFRRYRTIWLACEAVFR